jgi:hypothetical protein
MAHVELTSMRHSAGHRETQVIKRLAGVLGDLDHSALHLMRRHDDPYVTIILGFSPSDQ